MFYSNLFRTVFKSTDPLTMVLMILLIPLLMLLSFLIGYWYGKRSIDVEMNGCFVNSNGDQYLKHSNFVFCNCSSAWLSPLLSHLIFTFPSQKVPSFKINVETLSIPAAKGAGTKNKIAPLQDEVRKAQKQVGEKNKPKDVIITVEKAELGASNGKALCISGVDVGMDVAAVGEAVRKAMNHKVICAEICGGVAEKGDKGKVDVAEWLSNALKWWSCNGSVRKAQKQVGEENKPKAVIITVEKAELGASNEKALCISGVDVGVDVAAVGETVRKAMEHKVICGGVAEKGDKGKVDLAEWLSNALKWWSCNGSG
ncbi:hypothetical protein ACSQ67_022190 [Phaseolus vulgaris]